MPLTLTEIKSLVDGLGVRVPQEIVIERQRAEDFATRRQKLTAAGAQKKDGWWLKGNFDGVLKQAGDAAGQKQFEAASKLLDEADALLKKPDPPPALPSWEQAGESVSVELRQLYETLKQTRIPVLGEAANRIESVVSDYCRRVGEALTDYDKALGEGKQHARVYALKVVADSRATISNNKHMTAADTNPFGIKLNVRERLTTALAGLEKQLTSI